MWCVPPEVLCRQHLLGEHKELHQLVGHIRAGHMNAVRGHAKQGQIDTARILDRHTKLAEELKRREYNHNSPLEYDDELDLGEIDEESNFDELIERCTECRERSLGEDQ